MDYKDKDPNCDYPHAWGAMSLDVETLRFATEEMPHTGYIIPELIAAKIPVSAQEMNGNYYDCGTPTEYIRMLATELIHLDG